MKKDFAKKFFSNSVYGILGWLIFNFVFAITYFVYCEVLPPYIGEEQSDNLIYKYIIPFAIVYIVALIIVFFIGYFCMKDTGNVLSNMVSIFASRGVEMVILVVLVCFDYHLLPFVNWSVEILNYVFTVIYGFYLNFEFTPIWYFLTSLIPFAVMFVGMQFGKGRKKNEK